MDPLTIAILSAVASQFVGAGLQQAMPKHGMTNPVDPNQLGTGGSGGMDLNALVEQGQQPSQLGQLQLKDPFRRTQ